jgi:cell division protein FtsL
MKGLKLRSVIGLFCLVLTLAGVLVAHVWKQNAYVRMSMDLVKLGKQQAQLRNEIALLEVSVGGLKKIGRIESMAKGRFGLEYGKAPVLVYVDGEAERAAARGTGRTAAADARGTEGRQAASEGNRETQSGKIAWRINGF